MIRSDWQKELFDDSSFADLYWHARGHVVARDNLVVTGIVTFGLLGIFGYAATTIAASGLNPITISAIRSIVSIGLTYSSSILGFLVSGFALFFAITKSEILILLAKIDHTDNRISRLRFVLLSFMFVFAHYLAFLLTTMIVSILIAPSGVLAALLGGWTTRAPSCWNALAVVAVAIFGGWLTYLVMLLKSFVWNLYQTVLIAITVGGDLESGRLNVLLHAPDDEEGENGKG